MVAIRSKKRVISFDNSSIQNMAIRIEKYRLLNTIIFSFDYPNQEHQQEVVKSVTQVAEILEFKKAN